MIDLHVHSSASDGTLTPSEVVERAAQIGLEAIALTDHDTVDGVREALEAAAGTSLLVVPGIEMSAVYKGTEVHILGLFTNIHSAPFLHALEDIRRIRRERNEEMLRRFQKGGFSISREDLLEGNPQTVITRAHFARALTDKGYAADMGRAFKQFLLPGSPYYLPREEISPERAMEILQLSGAFPALAHPLQYKLGWQETRRLCDYLKDLGMKGLEVYHSSNNQYESGKLRQLARELGLLPTGGSDFHGSNKPDIELGRGRGGLRVSSPLLDDIRRSLAPD